MILFILETVLSLGVAAATATSENRAEAVTTKALMPGVDYKSYPMVIDGRQTLFLENFYMVTPGIAGISISRLGEESVAYQVGEYSHNLLFQVWIEGESIPLGTREENRPFFEGGNEYFVNIPLSREISVEEQDKVSVTLSVDGIGECQRPLLCDPIQPFSIKENPTFTAKRAENRVRDVVIQLDGKEMGKDYLLPYTLFIDVRRANGEIVSPPTYFVAPFKSGKYICPDVVLFDNIVFEPDELLYVHVGSLRLG